MKADEAKRLKTLEAENQRLKTAHRILLREGWTINRKRTRRIWRQEA
jgi:hypothetical protein